MLIQLLDVVNSGGACAMVGLLVLGFPIASRVWNSDPKYYLWSLRVGVATFALYVLAMFVREGRIEAGFWLSIFWRGLLTGAVAGVLMAIGSGIVAVLAAGPLGWTRRWLARLSSSYRAREGRRQAWRKARLEAELAAEIERRQAPAKRAALELAKETHQQAERREQLRDQHRYHLRLTYQSLRHDVHELLPSAEFEQLLEQALAPVDDDEIVRRSEKLAELIAALRSPAAGFVGSASTIEGLVLHYQERRRSIAEAELPDPVKEKLSRWLNREENQRLHQFVMEMD